MSRAELSIRHDIPGRLRLKVPGLGNERAHEAQLQKLKSLKGISVARTNAKCATLVLRYDPEALSREVLLDTVAREFVWPRETDGGKACARVPACGCSPGVSGTVAGQARFFGAVTAVVGAVFVRTTVLGATVSQTLFSPLGLVVAAFSVPLVRKGLRDITNRRPGIDSFLAGGILASVVGGEALTALEILWINSGADLLSVWIAERSRKHISEILEITSHHTFVLRDGVEVECEVSSVEPGETVVLHSGEKVCVDGAVAKGEALVDESPISGRPEQVHKKAGATVFAGSFVKEGVIQVKAEKVGDSTYLARVMHKVQESLETRAPIEGVADQLASRVVRLGFLATAATFLLTGSLWRAYTVLLVTACPCATVLAASTAVSASMNAAARNHILIKGGRYLEEIGKCKTVFFDKTGTLTTTQPTLTGIATAEGVDADTLLRLAASTETHNHHPLATAILNEAAERGVEPVPHVECDYHMGMGMRAIVNSDEILVGNTKLARYYGLYGGVSCPLEKEEMAFREQGLTVLHVYRNNNLQGILGFEARQRPEAEATIEQLRRYGVKRVVLITGDEDATARDMAWRLRMDAYHASVMPEKKGEIVIQDAKRHGPVLMVGDGINDALALTHADVGVSFGSGGAEVAVEAADIALVREDISGLVRVYAQSQKTLRVARENFWIATGSNLLGIVLGAMGWLSPVTAGLIHIGHSLGVLANSSRLLRLVEADGAIQPQTGEEHGFYDAGRVAQTPDHQTPRPGPNQSEV